MWATDESDDICGRRWSWWKMILKMILAVPSIGLYMEVQNLNTNAKYMYTCVHTATQWGGKKAFGEGEMMKIERKISFLNKKKTSECTTCRYVAYLSLPHLIHRIALSITHMFYTDHADDWVWFRYRQMEKKILKERKERFNTRFCLCVNVYVCRWTAVWVSLNAVCKRTSQYHSKRSTE